MFHNNLSFLVSYKLKKLYSFMQKFYITRHIEILKLALLKTAYLFIFITVNNAIYKLNQRFCALKTCSITSLTQPFPPSLSEM